MARDATGEDDALIGVSVLGYVIRRRIGLGGMGAVYEADEPNIGRRAAVKVLRPEVAENPEIVQRLVAEARAANAIRHRGIVDIFGFGALPDGRQCIVMEYLDGIALSDDMDLRRAQRKWYPLAESLEVLDEVLAALGAAHKAGVVHRDLKPNNIFVVNAGHEDEPKRIKLLDFGIAKLASAKAGPQTNTGVVLGTPWYMAPEQARNAPAAPTMDLYAVGVIAFELLTSRKPFPHENIVEVLLAHAQDPAPAPSSLEPWIPQALDRFVLKLLEKQPGGRYADAASARAELTRMRRELGAPVNQVTGELPTVGPASSSHATPSTPAVLAVTPQPAQGLSSDEAFAPFEATVVRAVPTGPTPKRKGRVVDEEAAPTPPDAERKVELADAPPPSTAPDLPTPEAPSVVVKGATPVPPASAGRAAAGRAASASGLRKVNTATPAPGRPSASNLKPVGSSPAVAEGSATLPTSSGGQRVLDEASRPAGDEGAATLPVAGGRKVLAREAAPVDTVTGVVSSPDAESAGAVPSPRPSARGRTFDAARTIPAGQAAGLPVPPPATATTEPSADGDPGDVTQTAGHASLDVTQAAVGGPARRTGLIAGGAIVLVALVGVGAWFAKGSAKPATAGTGEAPVQVGSQFTALEPVDVKPADPKPSDVKPSDVKPSDVKPGDVKPADAKPHDVKPADVKPADVKPADVKPSDVKPADVKPHDVKPADVKPADVKPHDVKPADVKPADVKPADVKPADVKPADVKAASRKLLARLDKVMKGLVAAQKRGEEVELELEQAKALTAKLKAGATDLPRIEQAVGRLEAAH